MARRCPSVDRPAGTLVHNFGSFFCFCWISSRERASTVDAFLLAGDVCRAGTGDCPAALTAKPHSLELAPLPAFLLTRGAQVAKSARSAIHASYGPVQECTWLALANVMQGRAS